MEPSILHQLIPVLTHIQCAYLYLHFHSDPPASVGRLLQPIKKRTRHIICDLCTPDGIKVLLINY